VNEKGEGNLAPFSFFNGISSNPPTVMISITRSSNGGNKDTLINILQTKQFVINSANEWLAEPMNQCSGDYPYGVNEMEKVGLTPIPSVKVRPPRVLESAFQMECELYNTIEVGERKDKGSSTVVIGRVIMFHVNDVVYDQEKKIIKMEKYKPVARLGGIFYSLLGSIFGIPRPKIENSLNKNLQ